MPFRGQLLDIFRMVSFAHNACVLLSAYFSEMDTPSLISVAAAATMSGVKRLSVPSRSFLPSLSNRPHAQPWGILSTWGRSSKSGMVIINKADYCSGYAEPRVKVEVNKKCWRVRSPM
jgi:hypothetical protein